MITWNLSRSDCSHLQHWQKLGFGVIWAGGVAQGVLSNKKVVHIWLNTTRSIVFDYKDIN